MVESNGSDNVSCLECGKNLSSGDISPYKHALICFHLEDRGVNQLMSDLEEESGVRGQRIRHILEESKSRENR